jgi:dolichol-phosphate mannosyltransferase
VLIVSSVGAAQLLCLGLLGEYIGRMYTQMQGRPTYFIAYDSLTATKGRHGPTDTPLPPDARLVAGSPPPAARPPDVQYASDEVAAAPAPAVSDASPRPETPRPEPGVPEPVPASAARVRRDEQAHAGELLDR